VGALGRPSDRDRGSWYFQRYVPRLPSAAEFVLSNRSRERSIMLSAGEATSTPEWLP